MHKNRNLTRIDLGGFYFYIFYIMIVVGLGKGLNHYWNYECYQHNNQEY